MNDRIYGSLMTMLSRTGHGSEYLNTVRVHGPDAAGAGAGGISLLL